jgi:hypothetical protein
LVAGMARSYSGELPVVGARHARDRRIDGGSVAGMARSYSGLLPA